MRTGPLSRSFWLVLVLFIYSLLGALVLPAVILHNVNQQLSTLSNQAAKLQRVEFNPFNLQLILHDFHLGDDPTPVLGFKRLEADMAWRSLWRGALELSELKLVGAQGYLQLDQKGQLNLLQVLRLPESDPTAPPAEDQDLFPLRIARLVLQDNRLTLEDLRPGQQVRHSYDAINLQLHNLSTVPNEQGELQLHASGPDGATLAWQGQLSLAPLGSSGQVQLTDVRLIRLAPYLQGVLPLKLTSGNAAMAFNYQLSTDDGVQLEVQELEAQLDRLSLLDADELPLLNLRTVQLQDTSFNLQAREIRLGALLSQGLETSLERDPDGSLNWMRLLPARQTDPVSDAQPAWRIQIDKAQLSDYHLSLLDRLPETPQALDIGPLNLELKGFDSTSTAPFEVNLTTRVGAEGALASSASVTLAPVRADIQLSLESIDLRPLQSYLSPYVRLELRRGALDAQLIIALDQQQTMDLEVAGEADLRDLHLVDGLQQRDLLKWQNLHVAGLSWRDRRLDISELSLQQPYLRFIINSDLSTNIDALRVPRPAEPEAISSEPPVGLRIGGIRINDGSANFADFSLRPNFATAIEQINGQIGTLDNQRNIAARVDLKGRVDRYAPVSIEGSLTPFSPLESLDIRTRFQQLELTTLTPYSGKFAGYRIRKGRLNLDLHYRIEQGRLNAENTVLLEDLQLGEQVDSDDALNLPIRLAVALLKDSQGNIDIQLPVRGDLNNPEFSVMPIVMQTLRNLLVRATQAPFKFIAGLVQGADDLDLSQIRFAPGSAELDAEAEQALATLASALKQRPNLQLDIEGMSSVEADGPLLAQQRLNLELQRRWHQQGNNSSEQATDLDLDSLSMRQRLSLLEAAYLERVNPELPEHISALPREQRLSALQEALLQTWQDSELLLRRLAQQRNTAIKAWLVDKGGLEDTRLYLLDVGTTQAHADGRVPTALHLDSR